MAYICDDCGAVFESPYVCCERRPDADGFSEVLREEQCPVCGSDWIHDAEICPVCGDYMRAGQHLCRDCREALALKVSRFFNNLMPAEVEQLDDWLDGQSIKDYM